MSIVIHDVAVENRILRHMGTIGASTAEEALSQLLDTQEEQDRWLLENRTGIRAKIRCGIDELNRGEGIPEEELDSFLAQMKSQSE